MKNYIHIGAHSISLQGLVSIAVEQGEALRDDDGQKLLLLWHRRLFGVNIFGPKYNALSIKLSTFLELFMDWTPVGNL